MRYHGVGESGGVVLATVMVCLVLEHDGDVMAVGWLGHVVRSVGQPQHHLDGVDAVRLAEQSRGTGQCPRVVVEQRVVERRRPLHHVQDGFEEVGNGARFGRRLRADNLLRRKTEVPPEVPKTVKVVQKKVKTNSPK